MKRLGILIITLLILSGCATKMETQPESMVIGLMPSMDGLPILVAVKEGYFDEEGLKVEYHIYSNGTDRETELTTGATDGAVTDVLGLITLNNSDQKFKATSSTDTVMSLLVNDEYKDVTPQKVATAEVSVTNYLLSHYLTNVQYEKEFIGAIPQRIELLQAGSVTMAVVPEPMASRGELVGLTKENMPMVGKYSPNVLIFNDTYISENKDAISKFYKAYNRAVDTIHKDEALARDILVEEMGLDASTKDLITIPNYSKAQLLGEEEFGQIETWIQENINITSNLPYLELVNSNFVNQ